MEGQFPPTREELYHVQMDVKHVQAVQINQADRLLRLEKRQADDAALKSVWSSPFPSVLGGTPQHGPISTPAGEVSDDSEDEHGQSLLGSLHLDAEDEPVRRGASRANSVRFDVSTIQGSGWAQGSRSSGEFGPLRPGSSLGSHPMMERSLSHKSDGRHSSAGHSIHSAPSGRTSSLGLDTNFIIGCQNDNSPLGMPQPPPGLFILGTVPSIIRCWLNENFSHGALLYAVLCTGSQKSFLDFSLVKELGLVASLQKNTSGKTYIKLPVYLPEALVIQAAGGTNSSNPHLPTMTATFDVIGVGQRQNTETIRAIRVFLGSDTLRAYNADILFSQNLMTLYGDDRNKLSVPFVRPEDESLFKNLCTTNLAPETVEATAIPFTPLEKRGKGSVLFSGPAALPSCESVKGSTYELASTDTSSSPTASAAPQIARNLVPRTQGASNIVRRDTVSDFTPSPSPANNQLDHVYSDLQDAVSDNYENDLPAADSGRREPSGGIWGSWRSGGFSSSDPGASREALSSGSYHRATRGGRSMKVLKPSKTSQRGRSSSGARTGASYEPPMQRISGDSRQKSQTGMSESNGTLRWEMKRTIPGEKPTKELRLTTNAARSPNPVGGASAFAWMNPGKTITSPMGAD